MPSKYTEYPQILCESKFVPRLDSSFDENYDKGDGMNGLIAVF